MKNFLTALGIFLISTHVQAGFITGYLVGSSNSSSSKTTNVANGLVFSEKHDVITCCRDDKTLITCEVPLYRKSDNSLSRSASPEYFVALNGYKTLYKIAFLPGYPRCDMIVMEVSK